MNTNITMLDLFLLNHPGIGVYWYMDPLNVIHIKMVKDSIRYQRCITKEAFETMIAYRENIFYGILCEMAEEIEGMK